MKVEDMKQIITAILIVLTVQICIGQTEKKQDYNTLFKVSDSINNQATTFHLSHYVESKLKKFDNKLPAAYFEESTLLFDAFSFEEASLIYYIGILRHKYYCKANPDYAPNYDWQVAESMQAAYGQKINLFLKTNIDRYISILSLATEYCQKNDYLLLPQKNNIEKYNSPIDELIKLKNDYLKNKASYVKQWNEERKSLL